MARSGERDMRYDRDANSRRERDRESSDRYRKREHEEHRYRDDDNGYGRSKRMRESGVLQPPLPPEDYSKNPPLPPGDPPPLPNEGRGGSPRHPPSPNRPRPPPLPTKKGSVAATAEAMVRREKERIRKRMEIASHVGGGSLDDARGSGKFDDSGNAGIMSGGAGLTEEEIMMQAMGFGGFNSSKGKKVITNETTAAKGGVVKHKTNEYRQYMNRRGGFNRPLGKPF